MWRLRIVILSLLLFAALAAPFSWNDHAHTSPGGSGKAKIEHSSSFGASKAHASVVNSDELTPRNSTGAPLAFEELWAFRTGGQAPAGVQQVRPTSIQDSESELTIEPGSITSGEVREKPHEPENGSIRIYVLYGQFGLPTSTGMYFLAEKLARYGRVSVHQWNDRTIVSDAKRQTGKIVIIGFSLGANSTAAIANRLPHVVLIVAYDPSRLSPLADQVKGEFVQHVKPTVRRAICFYNPNAWYFGGARLNGSQVETVAIADYHLAVPMDARLHDITEEAVRQVALASTPQEPSMQAAPRKTVNAVLASRDGKQVQAGSMRTLSRTAARTLTPDG
jgi:hypothetical protein